MELDGAYRNMTACFLGCKIKAHQLEFTQHLHLYFCLSWYRKTKMAKLAKDVYI